MTAVSTGLQPVRDTDSTHAAASGAAVPDGRIPGATLLPGYRIVGLLQRGRDFETYDAWSQARYSRCVVKVIRADREGLAVPALPAAPGGAAAGCPRPSASVRAYEVTTWPHPAVILETLTGATLSHLLSGGRNKLATESVAHLGCQLASGLQYLHDNGYLHLDLKPGNVIVQGGTAKLIDLSLTQPPGRVARGLGTADYLSPEQAAGDQVTAASDVWGLGVTLYEAATGANPFCPKGSPARTGVSASSVPSAAPGHSSSHAAGAERCPDCDESGEHAYLQTRVRAPRVRRSRRLPPQMARMIDDALEPVATDRPSLAQVHDGLRDYAGMGDLPW